MAFFSGVGIIVDFKEKFLKRIKNRLLAFFIVGKVVKTFFFFFIIIFLLDDLRPLLLFLSARGTSMTILPLARQVSWRSIGTC